ncbi:MAG: recombinase A [Polyangiaceae bacterium]
MVATLAKIRENEPLSLEALRSRLLHSARNFDAANVDLHSRGDQHGDVGTDLDWPELADILPGGGFPRGVVELSSPHAIGGSTAVALAAVRSAQKKSATQTHPNAIPAAWIDTDATLYAPGVAHAGVDLARLFVVRLPRSELGRIAVKVARSGAFELLVVDVDAIAGVDESAQKQAKTTSSWTPARGSASKMEVVVRKLALAAEANGMTVILITDANRHRAVPWPVAMRLELERRPGEIGVRVAKERHGRIGAEAWISLHEEK